MMPWRTPAAGRVSIRSMLDVVLANVDEGDPRRLIAPGHDDPAMFPCFMTAAVAVEAVGEAFQCAKYNSYMHPVLVFHLQQGMLNYNTNCHKLRL